MKIFGVIFYPKMVNHHLNNMIKPELTMLSCLTMYLNRKYSIVPEIIHVLGQKLHNMKYQSFAMKNVTASYIYKKEMTGTGGMSQFIECYLSFS